MLPPADSYRCFLEVVHVGEQLVRGRTADCQNICPGGMKAFGGDLNDE